MHVAHTLCCLQLGTPGTLLTHRKWHHAGAIISTIVSTFPAAPVSLVSPSIPRTKLAQSFRISQSHYRPGPQSLPQGPAAAGCIQAACPLFTNCPHTSLQVILLCLLPDMWCWLLLLCVLCVLRPADDGDPEEKEEEPGADDAAAAART